MAESFLQQQLKLFSDNQSGPKFTLIYGNRLKGYIFSDSGKAIGCYMPAHEIIYHI